MDSGTVVVDRKRLRDTLATLSPSHAWAVAENGGWSIFIPGLPLAADDGTFDSAVDEMIDALREYAEDWQDQLLDAPNHSGNWGLVQLVALSTDAQLHGRQDGHSEALIKTAQSMGYRYGRFMLFAGSALASANGPLAAAFSPGLTGSLRCPAGRAYPRDTPCAA